MQFQFKKYSYLFFNFIIVYNLIYHCFATDLITNISPKTSLKIDTLIAFSTDNIGKIGTCRLIFSLPAGVKADIMMKKVPSNTYNTVGQIGNSTSTLSQNNLKFDLSNLDIKGNIYCFQIIENSALGFQKSDELCSISIFKEKNYANVGGEERLRLGFACFQPELDGATYRPDITTKCANKIGCLENLENPAVGNVANSPYQQFRNLDNKVRCGEERIIQVRLQVKNMVTISDTIQFTGFTNNQPSKLLEEYAYATVENNKVKLVWKNDIIKNIDYTLEKKFILSRRDSPTGAFVNLTDKADKLTRTKNSDRSNWEYIDENSVASQNEHTYKLKYENYCNGSSESIQIAPIFLQQDAQFQLVWNKDYNDRTNNYELENWRSELDSSPTQTAQIGIINELRPSPIANIYRLKAKQKNGDGEIIYSNFTLNGEKIDVYNPTIFTPDDNNSNDLFKVFVSAQSKFSIMIYDKLGVLWYKADNYFIHQQYGWNGNLIFTDIKAPDGNYIFQVNVSNSAGKEFIKSGSFLLIRK